MAFVLGQVEQQALRSVKDLESVKEYGLRGLNIIRVNPDGVTNPTDQQLTFTIDSSKMSGNILINRIQMKAEVAVTAKGPLDGTAPTWTNATDWLTVANKGYLISPANGSLDALCLNKAFSLIDLSNKQVQLVQQSQSPEKVDILSRLLCPRHLEEAGIYLDNVSGPMEWKGAGKYELSQFFDPAKGRTIYARGADEETLQRNVFYKRNMNGQYIVKKSNVFTNLDGNTTIPAVPIPPQPYNTFQNLGGIKQGYNWDWVSGGAVANASQTVVYEVKEDLLHDILVSQYQKDAVYMGLPATDLVFTFTKSNVINSLYKTSNSDITGIEVKINKMELIALTYNYGLLFDIPVKDYYVPFFSEQTHQQNIQLSNDREQVKDGINNGKQMQTRQYNSVPNYISFYCQEPTSSSGTKPNNQNALKPCKINRIDLQIDGVDGFLYSMNIDELKHKSLTNLCDDKQNVDALFRREILQNFNTKTQGDGMATPNWAKANEIHRPSGYAQDRTQLDGWYCLALGKDIKLPSDMCVGQNRKVSFTFTFNFDVVQNTDATAENNMVTCVYYQTAYFASMYKFSPTDGLLKAERFVVSDKEFQNLVDRTNSMVKSRSPQNHQLFRSTSPLMVGSGFGLMGIVKSPIIRHIVGNVANLAGDIADEFDSDLARKISSGARTVARLVKPKKRKSRQVGRPRRLMIE